MTYYCVNRDYRDLDLLDRCSSKLLKNAWTTAIETLTITNNYKNTTSLRIISWNVHSFMDVAMNNTKYEMGQLLLHYNSDIILLQEAFVELFDHKYNRIYHNKTNGIAVLVSKNIKVDDIRVVVLPTKYKHHIACLVRVMGIDIITTHLDVEDGSDNMRLEQFRYILDRLVDPSRLDKTYITGDLNLLRKIDYDEEYWSNMGYIPTLAWDNGIYGNGWDDSNINALSVWSGRRVDYGLLHKSSILSIDNSQFITTSLSDHLPLMVDFKL
jgi:endonuclease/exonuclease/phosphatase family metal-dependent hydrolase